MSRSRTLLFALGLALASTVAAREEAEQDADRPSAATAGVDELVMTSEGFLSYHPDLRHRLSALADYRKGDYAEAFIKFKRAARYADKPSQGMLAEMLWVGKGTEVNRPEAYIWMDLAAERGYKMMLVKREQYWEQLTEAERARALEIGDAMYLEYADQYAKPRTEQRLRQARRKTTGSRTGFVGNLTVEIPTPSGNRIISGKDYYKDEYWKPGQYWRMQDSDWKDFGEGRVDIGELQSVGTPTVPENDAEEETDLPR
jgi:TPR repeat protein